MWDEERMSVESIQYKVEELDNTVMTLNDKIENILSAKMFILVKIDELNKHDVIIIKNKQQTITDIRKSDQDFILNIFLDYNDTSIQMHSDVYVMCLKTFGDII